MGDAGEPRAEPWLGGVQRSRFSLEGYCPVEGACGWSVVGTEGRGSPLVVV